MPLLRITLVWLLFSFGCSAAETAARGSSFRAGAFTVDISPPSFPVRVNAMFTERSATNLVDPLFAKALALDDGGTKLVLCIVDSCMLPRDLIDRAKAGASQTTGVPTERMLVSATHTHSAPSAMGCLGSRVDPQYADWLPARISAAIAGAIRQLAPAQVGWAQMDDWEHTFNRRWIRRPDRMLTDPFGEMNVRAHMHPGYESPDAVGPSGPVDPQLSVLAVRHTDGRPLAVLANYSMHYYGSPLLSSDYYGRFARHLSEMLHAPEPFVAIMSQGTSGDLMWMDYGAPRRDPGYDAYAGEMAGHVAGMWNAIQWRDSAPLRMAERLVPLRYRVPDARRLAWAREQVAQLNGKLPRTMAEIYAWEAVYLHDRPQTELKVQALGIGDLGIAALPNEVYAITGLKIKRHSPFSATFNIELANGAEGYIPPPEQHKLGGYTTWPARTAGLQTEAEPRLVETALSLLEEVASRPRQRVVPENGSYAEAILASKPLAYWRLEEMNVPTAYDAAGDRHAAYEDGVAVFLTGVDSRVGHQPPEPPAVNPFSGRQINRAAHFAGGRLRSQLDLGTTYSIELWLWNGLPADARDHTGFVFSRVSAEHVPEGEHLGLSGRSSGDSAGKLIFQSGIGEDQSYLGKTALSLRAWHHVVLVRALDSVRVYLNGQTTPEIDATVPSTTGRRTPFVFFGGRSDGQFGFEGKLDELAVYPRALLPEEIENHHRASRN